MVARGLREGELRVTTNGTGFLLGIMENVLELDNGDGGTNL